MGCQCSKNRSANDLVRQSSDKRSSSLLIGGNSEYSDIRDVYRLGPVLGSGSFGQVRVCLHRKTDQQFACKIMTKNPGKMRRPTSQPVCFVNMFKNEINILRSLDHPNVVKLIETYEDRNFLYAIMEKCDGGELFTKIVKKRRFSEVEASSLCREMIAAIAYIHSKHVVHRDVKAENFLFSKSKSSHNRLVLIDFGMSVQLTDPDRYLRQVCGSPHYVAPELIRRYYKKEVDLWALGVVVFLMLYGRYPFEGADQKAIAQKILKCEPDYQRSSAPPSDLAIKFIKGLLEKDPAKRFTPQEAMRHPWVVRYADHSVTSMGTGPSSSGRSPTVSHLRRASEDQLSAAEIEPNIATDSRENNDDGSHEEYATGDRQGSSPRQQLGLPETSEFETHSDSRNDLVESNAVPGDASYLIADNGGDADGDNEVLDAVSDADVGELEPLSSPNVYTLDNENTPWDSDDEEMTTRVRSFHASSHHLKSEYFPARRTTAASLIGGRNSPAGTGSGWSLHGRKNSSYGSTQRKKKKRHRQVARRGVVSARGTRPEIQVPATLPKKRVTASKGRFFDS